MNPKIVILAFLQNLWVKDPQRVRTLMERYGAEYRASIIRQLLFAGGLTGKRLKYSFGENLCQKIIWEEASPEIAGNSITICSPSLVHIQSVIDHYHPDVILTFGAIANAAVTSLWNGKLIHSPHPACRRADTFMRLKNAADELESLM